ncbi:MAG: hypothetical protein IMX02_07715 [Limnochordaceae bacterium]|nr:hypothetical protein [Limnochordaceae bacterium]
MDDERGVRQPPGDGAAVGQAAIKWAGIVIIVVAILYFLARYVIPLVPRG